jgi:hypothetical protein
MGAAARIDANSIEKTSWPPRARPRNGWLRTFRRSRRFRCMNSRAEAKTALPVGKKQILDQQLRIGHHRDLMAKFERDGHLDLLAQARRQLVEMEQTLAQMEAVYAGGPASRRRL